MWIECTFLKNEFLCGFLCFRDVRTRTQKFTNDLNVSPTQPTAITLGTENENDIDGLSYNFLGTVI